MACKDCKNCDKKGLLIFPMRYSALVAKQLVDKKATAEARAKDPSAKKVYIPDPALTAYGPGHATLGEGVYDTDMGQHARHAVRLLRNDTFIYVLIERAGVKYWECYKVFGNFQLFKFEPEFPPIAEPLAYCNRNETVWDAHMIAIPDAEKVRNAWFLYSPTPLTTKKLQEYKTKPHPLMQHLDPSAWVTKSNRKQKHTLEPDAFLNNYETYMQLSRVVYGESHSKIAQQQLFPVFPGIYGPPPTPPKDPNEWGGMIGRFRDTVKRRDGLGLVLYDHIGIAQEINNFRNGAFELIDEFLEEIDSAGYRQGHKFSVAQSLSGMKTAVEQKMLGVVDPVIGRVQKRMDMSDVTTRRFIANERAKGNYEGAQRLENDLRESEKKRTENFEAMRKRARETWSREFEPLLDGKAIKAAQDAVAAAGEVARAHASARAPLHLTWLRSERLLSAFDVFDPDHEQSGFHFASVAHDCYVGMDAIDDSAVVLESWIKADTVERGNLFMRGYLYNQDIAKRYADEAIKAAKENAQAVESNVNWSGVIKGSQKLIDFFKKADSAWDEWARQDPKGKRGNAWQAKGFDGTTEGKVLSKFSSITRVVFRAGLKNQNGVLVVAEKKVVAHMAALLYAKLGKTADSLQIEQVFHKIDPEFPFEYTEHGARFKGQTPDREDWKTRKPDAKAGSLNIVAENPYSRTEGGHKVDPTAHREGLNKTLQDAIENPQNSNYHQLRLGGVLAALELINIGIQTKSMLTSDKKISPEDFARLTMGVLGLTAILCDIAYTAAKVSREQVDWLVEKGAMSASAKSVARGAGEITRGGFKLAAGLFGATAGTIGVVLDGFSAVQSAKKEAYFLFSVQFLKTATGAFYVVVQAAAAFSYSGQYLTRLAIRTSGRGVSTRMLFGLGRVASVMSARVALLTWVVRLNAIGIALTVLEIAYHAYFDEKAMSVWCKRSAFSRAQSPDRFGSLGAELEDLERAFSEL